LAGCVGVEGLKLWNVETQQEILTLAGFDDPRQVLFSSDDSCLAVRSLDSRLQLWRAPSFEEIAATEAKEQPPATSAEALSRAGKYAEAAQVTREFIKSRGAELDGDNWWRGSIQRMILAATLLAAGDRDGYRAACAEAANSARNTIRPGHAEQIAKTCLLAPDSGVDAASLAALVATAQARETGKHWLQLVNALAEYRLGHWNTAADWATQTRTNAEAPGPCTAAASAILAMAEHQQKQSQKARATLIEAKTAIAANWPAGTESNWYAWLIADLLAREADALINKTAATAKP
jgi:hypothetical protein